MAIPRDFPYAYSGKVELLDEYGSVTVAAGATETIISKRVSPQVGLCWLTVFGHGIDTLTAFADSIFRINVNGVPVNNYNDIRDQLAQFSDPQPIAPIVLKGEQEFSVTVVNNDSVSHLYAARLRGFYDYILREVEAKGGRY